MSSSRTRVSGAWFLVLALLTVLKVGGSCYCGRGRVADMPVQCEGSRRVDNTARLTEARRPQGQESHQASLETNISTE